MNDLISFLRKYNPEDASTVEAFVSAASEAIVIGSASKGWISKGADLDILLVGKGPRLKTDTLDLLWVNPEKLEDETWLGSELAAHAARYGIWIKGDGSWRGRTFVSGRSVRHKSERILQRFCRIYAKRQTLTIESKHQLHASCVIDMQRLVLLAADRPVPPTLDVLSDFLSDPYQNLCVACKDALLGTLGAFMIDNLMSKDGVITLLKSIHYKRLSAAKFYWKTSSNKEGS